MKQVWYESNEGSCRSAAFFYGFQNLDSVSLDTQKSAILLLAKMKLLTIFVVLCCTSYGNLYQPSSPIVLGLYLN